MIGHEIDMFELLIYRNTFFPLNIFFYIVN